MIVYFNLWMGIEIEGGLRLPGLAILFVVAGLFIRPLLILGIALVALTLLLARLGPRLWDKKTGWIFLVTGAIVTALSMFDHDFFLIAAKPDNVPIVAMIFLLGFFTWLALRKAYLNDRQIASGGIRGRRARPARSCSPGPTSSTPRCSA